MCIVAIELGLTVFPTAILADMRTTLRIVEEKVGRPTEVLLPMCVVTLAPVVDGRVTNRTEGRLITVEHELMVRKNPLQVLQIMSKSLFAHESAH